MAEIINLYNEPVIGCSCPSSCDIWRLITRPEKDKVPRKVIAFECVDCKKRIKTDITMGEIP